MKGQLCIIVPNFIKISQTTAEILHLMFFFNCGHPPSGIIENLNIWTIRLEVQRVTVRNFGDIANFLYLR